MRKTLRETRGRLLRAVAAAGAMLLAVLPAAAHPDMCVTVESAVLIENGTFAGIKHKWTFDEAYTTMAVEGLDTNNDGRFDRAELDELAKVNIEAMKELDYFTYPEQAGTALKLAEPKDYWLEHKDGALALYFTLPFASPPPIAGKPLTFSVRDSTNFIAFGIPKTSPKPGSKTGDTQTGMSIAGTAPKTCKLKVEMPPPEDLTILNEILNALGCNIVPPAAISVDCSGP